MKRLPLASKLKLQQFDFLKQRALELGASGASIIPTKLIVVEDRVVLKCRLGCTNYGKTLMCPPHAPSAERFQKIISEFNFAMMMKFPSKAKADAELMQYLGKSETDPAIPSEFKPKVTAFWATWRQDKRNMLCSVVELEKEAMRRGYLLAIGITSGACQLCENCNVDSGKCVHPDMARFSEEAVGVNVKRTAKNAGLPLAFPFESNPESYALLLID